MSGLQTTALSVNGRERSVEARLETTLLEALRDQLSLTGAKRGCNQGVCGACTVMLDGRAVRACLTLALDCEGREVRTIEGLAQGTRLSRVQAALADTGAVQCGFCTPGIIISAEALLEETPDPTADEVREGLSGNLCRCSGYRKIVDAVLLAASRGAADA